MSASPSRPEASSSLAVGRDSLRRAALEAHLREFLGAPAAVLSEKASRDIHLDVQVFAPSAAAPHVTLVTAGMSDRPMLVPRSGAEVRLELLLALPAGWPGLDPLVPGELAAEEHYWPLRLLKDVARLPSSFDTFLTWGTTVDGSAGGLDGGPAPFSGALVGPPLGMPAELMRAPTPRGEVQLLAVLPLTAAEVAYKASLPSGGEALVDRMIEAGIGAVVDPGRTSAVEGPAPWAVHVLLRSRPRDLGEVLSQALPELAPRLSEQDLEEHVLEAGAGQQVRMRLGGPVHPATMEGALGAAPGAGALRAAVAEHTATVTLTPEQAGPGAPVTAVMAMVALLIEHADPLVLWLPHQDHATSPGGFAADLARGVLVHYRVHPTGAPEGMRAASTRGLAALGGLEVLARSRHLSQHELAQRLHAMVEGVPDDAASALPAAGRTVAFGASEYVLVEAVDPVSGQRVLEVRERSAPGR